MKGWTRSPHPPHYLMAVDYYSDYFERVLLSDTSAELVVSATKLHFAGLSIADMFTDNGPQYSSANFARFACE